jgi:hypothetical protein
MEQDAFEADEQRRLQGEIEAALGAIYRELKITSIDGDPLENEFRLVCWAAGIDADVVKRQNRSAA